MVVAVGELKQQCHQLSLSAVLPHYVIHRDMQIYLYRLALVYLQRQMLSFKLKPIHHTFIKARWMTLLMGNLVPVYKGQMGAESQKKFILASYGYTPKSNEMFSILQRISPLFVYCSNCLQNLSELRLTISIIILYPNTVVLLVEHKKIRCSVTYLSQRK